MRLLSGIMLVVALAACGRTPPSGPDNSGLGAITAIAMQKTPCYGTCAAYTVRLSADGRARYDGLLYAPLQGRFSGKFDFGPLAAWIATQHPETLAARYPTAPTDAPGVNLAIDYGARRVTFTNVDEARVPLRLEGILLAIDGATSRIQWRRDDATTAFLGNFTTGAVTLNLNQDSAGTFYGYTVKGEHCADPHGLRIVAERGAMRLRCGTRTSVVRIAGGDLLATGDAIPAGRYRRITPYAAAVQGGWRPEPRATE